MKTSELHKKMRCTRLQFSGETNLFFNVQVHTLWVAISFGGNVLVSVSEGPV